MSTLEFVQQLSIALARNPEFISATHSTDRVTAIVQTAWQIADKVQAEARTRP